MRKISTQMASAPKGDEVWRKSPLWDIETYHGLKNDVKTFVPPKWRGIQHVNILLIGPIGAGKSSFFNTVSSVFKERISSQAVCGSAEKSITTTFRNYRFRDAGTNKVLPFQLCDTRGLEEDELLDEKELNLVLNGNILDGYKHGAVAEYENKSRLLKTLRYLLPNVFNLLNGTHKQTIKFCLDYNRGTLVRRIDIDHRTFPTPVIPGYRKRPTYADEIHCVCFVLDGSTAEVLSPYMSQKVKAIQRIIRDKAIPQVFLLTKMDKVCPLVDKDVTAIFRSQVVKELVENAAQLYGVQRSHVLPLKNYENETDVSTEINILVLHSLKYLLSCAEEYLFDIIDRNENVRASDEVL